MTPELKEKMQKAAKDYIRKTCKKNCRFELDCKGYNSEFSQSDLHTNCRKRYQSFRDGEQSMYDELKPLVEWVSVDELIPPTNELILFKSKVRNGAHETGINYIISTCFATIEKGKAYSLPYACEKHKIEFWRKIEL